MINNKQIILDFLTDLSQNNSKEWMDANRKRYHTAKENWLLEIQKILTMLSKHDHSLNELEPKKCISRITNNRMYNQNLPVYKDYFTFSIMDKSDAFSPLHISIGVQNSFIGCGYHNPDKNTLKNIRDGIDYEGQVLKDILEDKTFNNFFGGLSDFTPTLKTSPRGYAKDHEFVEYLRYKAFTVGRDLTHEEFVGDNFIELVEEAYLVAEPFRNFLKKANSI